jgi:hypothetical protein
VVTALLATVLLRPGLAYPEQIAERVEPQSARTGPAARTF